MYWSSTRQDHVSKGVSFLRRHALPIAYVLEFPEIIEKNIA